ncbi:hypothetical protein [Pontibacter brevis]
MKRNICLTAMAAFALIGAAFTSGCSSSKPVEEVVQDPDGTFIELIGPME